MLELGSGGTTVRVGDQQAQIDLLDWVIWIVDTGESFAARPFDQVKAAGERFTAQTGLPINLTQAEELLHAVLTTYEAIKKKRGEGPTSASSTEWTPSG